MSRFTIILIFTSLAFFACSREENSRLYKPSTTVKPVRQPVVAAVNPDPNHTHADFAVWLAGKRLDVSAERFMSGSSNEEKDDQHPHGHLHPYLHLHDGNGQVIHRHKPGMTIGAFIKSLPGHQYEGNVYRVDAPDKRETHAVRLFVNGGEIKAGSAYVFQDLDHLLITDAMETAEVIQELRQLSDDACLYSQTCPERGTPPKENCVADPEVPCVLPEKNLMPGG